MALIDAYKPTIDRVLTSEIKMRSFANSDNSVIVKATYFYLGNDSSDCRIVTSADSQIEIVKSATDKVPRVIFYYNTSCNPYGSLDMVKLDFSSAPTLQDKIKVISAYINKHCSENSAKYVRVGGPIGLTISKRYADLAYSYCAYSGIKVPMRLKDQGELLPVEDYLSKIGESEAEEVTLPNQKQVDKANSDIEDLGSLMKSSMIDATPLIDVRTVKKINHSQKRISRKVDRLIALGMGKGRKETGGVSRYPKKDKF